MSASMDTSPSANVTTDDRAATVVVTGALDIASEPAFTQRIEALRREGHTTLRVDLSRLRFIDSRGLGALLRTWRDWVGDGSAVAFVAPIEPHVRRVLEISGVDDELPFAGV